MVFRRTHISVLKSGEIRIRQIARIISTIAGINKVSHYFDVAYTRMSRILIYIFVSMGVRARAFRRWRRFAGGGLVSQTRHAGERSAVFGRLAKVVFHDFIREN